MQGLRIMYFRLLVIVGIPVAPPAFTHIQNLTLLCGLSVASVIGIFIGWLISVKLRNHVNGITPNSDGIPTELPIVHFYNGGKYTACGKNIMNLRNAYKETTNQYNQISCKACAYGVQCKKHNPIHT